LSDDVEQLRQTGAGNIDGTGNASDNKMIGNFGDNVLSGLGGRDLLAGGAGNDTLFDGDGNDLLNGGRGTIHLDGGAGNEWLSGDVESDPFVLGSSTVADADHFRDFQSGTDTVEIAGAVFDLAAGSLDPATFAASANGAATTADQRFLYNTINGGLYF